jgi:hypothetical protein
MLNVFCLSVIRFKCMVVNASHNDDIRSVRWFIKLTTHVFKSVLGGLYVYVKPVMRVSGGFFVCVCVCVCVNVSRLVLKVGRREKSRGL